MKIYIFVGIATLSACAHTFPDIASESKPFLVVEHTTYADYDESGTPHTAIQTLGVVNPTPNDLDIEVKCPTWERSFHVLADTTYRGPVAEVSTATTAHQCVVR